MGEAKTFLIYPSEIRDKTFPQLSALLQSKIRTVTLRYGRMNWNNYSEEINFEEYSAVYDQMLPLHAFIPGSARDYFRDQSMGLFTPRFDVIGPVTLDNPRKHYGANTNSGNDKNARAMITEACRKAYEQGLTDFTGYDGDGDGIADKDGVSDTWKTRYSGFKVLAKRIFLRYASVKVSGVSPP